MDGSLLRFDLRPLNAADIPGPSAGPEEVEQFCRRIRGQYPLPPGIAWQQMLEQPEEWGLLALASGLFMRNRRRHWWLGDEQAFRDLDEFKRVRAVVCRMAELLAVLDGREAPYPDDAWETADVDGAWSRWEAPLIAAADAEEREYERLRRLPTERRAMVDGLQIVATVRWLGHGGPEVRVVDDGRVVVKGRVVLPDDLVGRFVLGEVSPESLVAALRERHLLAGTGAASPKSDDPSAA